MRILSLLLGLFALASSSGVFGQNVFPLTSLTVQALGQAANPISMAVTPDFSSYNQKILRYATEYSSLSPISIRIGWTANNLNGDVTKITFRNCGSSLSTPSAAGSHCSFISSVDYTNGASNIIEVSGLFGVSYLELLTTATINGKPRVPVAYILTVGVFSGEGNAMLSLDTEYGSSNYNAPFTGQRSLSIGYATHTEPAASYGVNFYFATQSTVSTVFVQECPSKSCSACDSERKVIAGSVPFISGSTPFPIIPEAQIDVARGNFAAGSNVKHGRYTFPAVNGSNCLRIINRLDSASAGVSEYIATLSLNVQNCGAFTTCGSCVGVTGCGWCLTDNFVQMTGSHYCRVANADYSSALSGGVCSTQSALTVPRFVSSVANCEVGIKGDPRFSGLQGQDFQVHGTPNEYFNLVSTPSLQINSRFIFLNDAKCDNFTACFSHPGTYIDEIGIMMAEKEKVRLLASGIHQSARVFINEKEIKLSTKHHRIGSISVTFSDRRRIIVKTPDYMMTVSQSDHFFNIDSALFKTELLDQGAKLVRLQTSRAPEENKVMHGLIGQTWRNMVYAGDRQYEGEVPDYQVQDGIWGTDFLFNLYQN